MKNTNIIL